MSAPIHWNAEALWEAVAPCLPGFTIDGGLNFGNRGLGQAAGNVLLNGMRIATKSGSITDELARIPATSVIRIELVEGATLNIPGITGRVANVIARSTDGLKGQFEWRPQLAAEYADTRWLAHYGFSAFQAPNPASGLS